MTLVIVFFSEIWYIESESLKKRQKYFEFFLYEIFEFEVGVYIYVRYICDEYLSYFKLGLIARSRAHGGFLSSSLKTAFGKGLAQFRACIF